MSTCDHPVIVLGVSIAEAEESIDANYLDLDMYTLAVGLRSNVRGLVARKVIATLQAQLHPGFVKAWEDAAPAEVGHRDDCTWTRTSPEARQSTSDRKDD